jgi:hypothetical protein
MAPLRLGSGYSLTILERGGFQRIGLTGGSAKMNSTPRTTIPFAVPTLPVAVSLKEPARYNLGNYKGAYK